MAKEGVRKRSKRAKPARPEPHVITIPYVAAGTSFEDAKALLANKFPAWEKLNELERDEAVQLVLANGGSLSPVQVKLTLKPEGGYDIELGGKSQSLTALKLHNTFRANSMDVANARASELINYLSSVGACEDGRYNAALSFVESMEPRDQMEAMLLVQMYATHDSAVRALARIGRADFVPQMQTYGNLAAKLLRVSQAQMETLAKLRRGGEQVIKHVHIDNRGGQAVVAEQVMTGGQNVGILEQPYGPGAALPGPDPLGFGVPVAGGPGEEAVPAARRTLDGSASG